MCKADLELLMEYLINNLNQRKYLSEWKVLFNKELPSNRRLTDRELAFAFRVLARKENNIIVEKFPNSYRFLRVSSSPAPSKEDNPMPLV